MKLDINENITIESSGKTHIIYFKYSAYSIINSLLKTRIILGGPTDPRFKTITFNANLIKTLNQYQDDETRLRGFKYQKFQK